MVKKNSNEVQSKILTSTKQSIKQVIEKVNEKERRSCNLMIYGLPERENENGQATCDVIVLKILFVP